MCFSAPTPQPTVIDTGSRTSSAAADALVARRKDAQGFSTTLGNGAPATQPTLGRQLLLGAG
jgi:hypothetical protein